MDLGWDRGPFCWCTMFCLKNFQTLNFEPQSLEPDTLRNLMPQP